MIPFLLFGTGSADLALAAKEYGVRVDRTNVARAELEKLQKALGTGGLVDRAALTAAEARLAQLEFDQALAGVIAAISVVGASVDGLQAGVQAVRILGAADDAVDVLTDAARSGDAAASAAPGTPASAKPPPASGGAPPRGPPAGASGLAGSDFNPVGSLDNLRPPGLAGTGAALDSTVRVERRAWGAAEGGVHRQSMLLGDAASKTLEAGQLRGAQFAAVAGGNGIVVELGTPISAGGFGTVLKADVLPARAAVRGIDAARAVPFSLRGLAPLEPLVDGQRVAVKLFENSDEGIEALRAEMEGAAALHNTGIPYARYHAVGLLPDGTPYAVKQLLDTRQLVGETMDAATQAAVVNGRAAMARAGLVGLDTRSKNFFTIDVKNADGTVTKVLGHVEADAVGSTTSPTLRMSDPNGVDPFNMRFDLPEDPMYALGGGARPIGSLMSLEDVPAVKNGLKSDPWVNNIIEAERRGEITFNPQTKTFVSGSTDINLWRNHPDFGKYLAQYEAILQRTATSMTDAPVTPAIGAARVATNAGPAGDGVAARAAALGMRLLGEPSAAAAAGRVIGGRVILRVLAADPFGFLADEAPHCWSSIEQLTRVPASSGGGWLMTILTSAQLLFEQALKNHPSVGYVEADAVRKAAVADPPNDPFYRSRGSWSQGYDDQWGLKRIGFADSGRDAALWDRLPAPRRHVIVAVIDSGLDLNHPDLAPDNIWRNPRELPNGIDDDRNGYVDDLVGWNFVAGSNDPSDDLGHGTHVAGVIAATSGNAEGIAGINHRARIMPLKVLNAAGQGRISHIAEAIFYAVRHGAHIINLSLGDRGITRTERLAIEHARNLGAVVVIAAGNEAVDTAEYGPAGIDGAITVAATGLDDRRLGFSNFGDAVLLAAPGHDILSLRAAGTDFNRSLGVEGYVSGSAIVGTMKRYYRATGTSFAVPFVSGVASLLLLQNPQLTTTQIENMLLMSATDIDTPGWDRNTGAGRLTAMAALRADPDFFLRVQVQGVQPVRDGNRTVIEVRGTVAGSGLRSYRVQLGQGESPKSWKSIGDAGTRPIANGVLGMIPASEITSAGRWTIRVLAQDGSGVQREARGTLTIR
jgi:hypothetical protein